MADNYPHGLFSWADLASPDPASAKDFYSGLFGWHAEDVTDPEGNYIYTMFSIDGKNVAGMGPQPEMMKGMPPALTSVRIFMVSPPFVDVMRNPEAN